MARPPRFTISALADLLHELRYAPPETLARQMQAAEALLAEIDPQRNYPEDYVRFRITAFRGERGGGALFVGSALMGDLAKFVERLSASLGWSVERYAPRQALLPTEVAERLSVSPVTLHRYRKEGLVAHQAVLNGTKPRLIYFEDAVDRFAQNHQRVIQSAAKFTRIDARTRERIILRANRYARTLDLSLNEAAKRLAKRFGRSHEGVRRLLQQHDRRNPQSAIFADVGPLTERQRRLILRAHDRAVPAPVLARRLSKAVNTIYRAAVEQRAERLRAWEMRCVELPTFRLEAAERVILSNAVVAQDLPVSLETGGEFTEWMEQARRPQLHDEVAETQCVAGLHFLLWSARNTVNALDRRQPRAADIDRAETRLRWATRLKAKLLAGLRANLISTVEIHIGRKLAEAPTAEIEIGYRLMIDAAVRAIDLFDPSRQGRLVQVAIHSLRSDLARRPTPESAGTAKARRDRSAITLPDQPGALFPWRHALELRDGALRVAGQLEPEARNLLGRRFGWFGQAPQTYAEIGLALDRPVHRVTAADQRARRQLAQLLRVLVF